LIAGKRQYSNYIVASNRGAGRQTKAEIVFNIIQRNDNIPEFIVNDRPPVNAYAPVGITILLIKVTLKVSIAFIESPVFFCKQYNK